MNRDEFPLPPHSTESEQSVLGALMQAPDAFDSIAGKLDASMFFNQGNGMVFRAISDMILESRPVDVVTVAEDLEGRGQLDNVGGLGYLAEITHNTPSAANIRRYADIVRDRWQTRRLAAAGHEIVSMTDASMPINEALDKAQSMLLGIAETRPDTEAQPIANAMRTMLDQIEAAFESGTGVVGISTGLADLDNQLGGLRGGQLIIIAGRPAMGKTTLSMQIAHHAARNHCPTLVCSMEMPATELAAREVARIARLSVTDMMRGKLHDEDWAKLTHGISMVNYLPMYVDEQGNLSITEVAAKTRTAKRKHGIGLLVIDYLQLMRGDGDNRNQEIERITRGLKSMAKELNIPIIALSQLSRKCEERTNKRPMLSDLRESGGIEQDADVVLFIYRDEVYDPGSQDKGTAEIIVGKQRNGATGRIRTTFIGEYAQFADYAGEHFAYSEPAKTKRRGMEL